MPDKKIATASQYRTETPKKFFTKRQQKQIKTGVMASYASRRCNVDANGNLQLRETEDERKREERKQCARKSIAMMGKRKHPRMTTGGWKLVGGKSVHVYPRGTIITTYFGSEGGWMFGVVTEDRVVQLENAVTTRWYTVTYEDGDEEEVDAREIRRSLVRP